MPSDALFLLVKSMSKAEKRIFKLDMSRYMVSGNKLCLLLFEILESQKIYDEKEISKKLKKIAAYNGRLTHVKTYLHKKIIKSLRHFYDDSSSRIKLNNYLNEIEILYKKELFRDCLNTIKKAKAFAEKYERLSKLQEIIAWESQVALHLNDAGQIEKLQTKWIGEEREILKKMNEIVSIKQLSFDIKPYVIRKGTEKRKDDQKFLHNISASRFLRNKASSFYGELNRLLTAANCVMSSDGDTYHYLKEIKTLFESNEHQIEEHINIYVFVLLETANILLSAGKNSAAEALVREIKILYDKKYEELNIGNRLIFLQLETSLLLSRGDFLQALSHVDKINTLLENTYRELDPVEELLLHYLRFNVYFSNGDFKSAQHHIQKIINSEHHIRHDIQAAARLAYLILQYEQHENEHLDYLLRSTYRYLQAKKQLFLPESILIDFLRKTLKQNSEEQRLKAIEELKEQIRPFINQDNGNFMAGFPLIEWMDSKLQKRDLAEITREKFLNNLAIEKAGGTTFLTFV